MEEVASHDYRWHNTHKDLFSDHGPWAIRRKVARIGINGTKERFGLKPVEKEK